MEFQSPYTRPSSYHSSPPTTTTTSSTAALASPTYSTSPTSSISNASPLPPNDILGLMSVGANPDHQQGADAGADGDEWADWLSWGSHSANSTLRASQLNPQRDAHGGGWDDDLMFPFEQHRPSGGPNGPPTLSDLFSNPFAASLPSPSPSPTFGHALPGSLAAAFATTPELTPERDPYLSSPPSTAGMSHHSHSSSAAFSPHHGPFYSTSPAHLASPLSCGPQLQDLHLGSPLHSSPLHHHHQVHQQHHASFLSSSAPSDFPFSHIFGSGSLPPLATTTASHPSSFSHSHPAFSPSPKPEPHDEDAIGSSDSGLEYDDDLDAEIDGEGEPYDPDRSPSPGDSDSDYVDSGVSLPSRARRSSRRSSTSSAHAHLHPGGHTRKPPTKIPLPVPVPNLTKKSRGRHVPTLPGAASPSQAAAQAGRRAAEELAQGEWRAPTGTGIKGRTYLCKICGKCFQRGEHLKRHVRSIHTHDKPHECPHPGCGKLFSRHDNLHQHMRVHRKSGSSSASVVPQSY